MVIQLLILEHVYLRILGIFLCDYTLQNKTDYSSLSFGIDKHTEAATRGAL